MTNDTYEKRLAVDIGGTFVDAITVNEEGLIKTEKTPTTVDPEDGVLEAINVMNADVAGMDTFVHGTTIGINAYLERKGAKTGIITNEGHRDVLEIARASVPRSAMYDVHYRRPPPLVRRQHRIGVPGRMDFQGNVITPLDRDAVQEASEYLVQEHDIESIAVCFLHSYVNPAHEQLAEEIIQKCNPDINVSISCNLASEFREYERTSTTVLDGYIKPRFSQYVGKLSSSLAQHGFDGQFFITRSGGGAFSVDDAKKAPIHTILSGPAGGLIGAEQIGKLTGHKNLIAVDMGGTSLDTCLVKDGRVAVSYESTIDGQPLLLPTYDLRTIGTGGGSIARVEGNLLKVGPNSAGANPGPICYDRGGSEPTVTDAALVLGYLDPDAFLGGDMPLDAKGARKGVQESLANPLGMEPLNAAKGVFDILRGKTIGALREITVEEGFDPRDFGMVAYGGAGPMIMPSVAREMQVDFTIIPNEPSVFSAWGMLWTDVIYDHTQTRIKALEQSTLGEIKELFDELKESGKQRLADEGFAPDNREFQCTAAMRYSGQEHYVEVPFDGVSELQELSNRFEKKHRERYEHIMHDEPEIVHFRVRAIGNVDKPVIRHEEATGSKDPQIGQREAYCFEKEDNVLFDVYTRRNVGRGMVIEGPAIIQEKATTIVLFSDQVAEKDDLGNLVISGRSEYG